MTWPAQVDAAIKQFLKTNPGRSEFAAHELAKIMGVPRWYLSNMLQVHRAAQRKGTTKYIADSRGYGRAALWYILSGPGVSAARKQRLTLGHTAHIVRDAQCRVEADLSAELAPAMRAHPNIQVLLKGMEAQIEAAINGTVNAVNASLDLIEQTTGLVPDRRGVA